MVPPWRNQDIIPHKQSNIFNSSGLKVRRHKRGNRDIQKWKLTGLPGHTSGKYHSEGLLGHVTLKHRIPKSFPFGMLSYYN